MIRHLAVALALALATTAASAKDTAQCGQVLAAGTPTVAQAVSSTRLLCYRAYAVLYSNQTRTALWSAERLTAAAVDAARTLPRDSDFYEEDRLPAADRARLADFAKSGYDRGHLSPSGDFADKASQAESFSLANIVRRTAYPTVARGATSKPRHVGWPVSTAQSRLLPAPCSRARVRPSTGEFGSPISCGRPSTCQASVPPPMLSATTQRRLTAPSASMSLRTSRA